MELSDVSMRRRHGMNLLRDTLELIETFEREHARACNNELLISKKRGQSRPLTKRKKERKTITKYSGVAGQAPLSPRNAKEVDGDATGDITRVILVSGTATEGSQDKIQRMEILVRLVVKPGVETGSSRGKVNGLTPR
jgi:hypothetical protein